MALYRTKQIEFEALKLSYSNVLDVYNLRFDGLVNPEDTEVMKEFEWYRDRCISKGMLVVSKPRDCDNDIEIEFGQYLVKDSNGEFHVCGSDTFELFFESAE